MSLCLTEDELIALTGYKRHSYIAKWLTANGFTFEIRADGSPAVDRKHFHYVMGGEPEPEAEGEEIFTTEHPRHPIYEGLSPWNWHMKRHATLFLPVDRLLAMRQPWKRGSGPFDEGIYFLWLGDELLYVGLSNNIKYRLFQHSKVKRFDGFSYITVPRLLLSTLEREYIKALAPPLNEAHR